MQSLGEKLVIVLNQLTLCGKTDRSNLVPSWQNLVNCLNWHLLVECVEQGLIACKSMNQVVPIFRKDRWHIICFLNAKISLQSFMGLLKMFLGSLSFFPHNPTV